MLEISTLEAQLREKKTAIEKLFAVLTPQEKLLLDLPDKEGQAEKKAEAKAPKKA